ncbi:hypothetical protein H072_5784 [Dactylellina haptotyla CBS 200.50]|uniref:Uncharacterized protein n=1 Tax=Dactylellina haptotyla (strain CBS 200.50) TaxID=1284197 RepID=S8AGY2_DACHA|nr:hypothetical protein H072_5784 [Dactylellina haptotyla CBS 200.50]
MVQDVYLITRPLGASAHKYENGRFVSSGSSRSSGNTPNLPIVSRFTDKVNHWALKIGYYTHELFTSEDGSGDIIYHRSIWDDDECASIATNMKVGMTFLSDEDIKKHAKQVISDMKGEGKYHEAANNCQEFVHRLGEKIIFNYEESELFNRRSIKGTLYQAAAGVAYTAVELLTHDYSKGPRPGAAGQPNHLWGIFKTIGEAVRKSNNGY